MKPLQNFDLNLLISFNALMTERSVSKAAEKVNLSQSAMSHSLNRLRMLLDDPIMVKTNKGMRPTLKALSLEVPIRDALIKIQQNLYTQENFDPLVDKANFMIIGPEYFETIYLPNLFEELQTRAPNVNVMVGVLSTEIDEKLLTNGEVDYVIGIEGIHIVSSNLVSQPWLYDKLTCVVRKDNKKIGDKLSLQNFIDATHIHHSTLGSPQTKTFLDKWLGENDINRYVAVNVPGYLSALMITESTDFLFTLPSHVAEMVIKKLNLRIVEPPERFPEYKLNLIWHPLYENEPHQVWFREKLISMSHSNLNKLVN